MKRENKRRGVFTRRALAIAGGQTALLGLLTAKLYQVQVDDGARYASLAHDNRVSTRLLAPQRGRILDRNGVLLAGNQLNWRALLYADQSPAPERSVEAFAALVPLDGRTRARIARDLRNTPRFIPVLLQDFLSWEQMARIEVSAPDLPGIVVDVGSTRIYPDGPDLAHVVGYVAPPNQRDVADAPVLALPGMRVGRAGVEQFQDRALRGQAGDVQMEVDAVGRVVRELSRQDGVPGEDVTLSIDQVLQNELTQRLAAIGSASAVVMDVRSGEVIAMGSAPSFDPSLFDTGVSETQWRAWMSDEKGPLTNKALDGVYPPGSTFKMAVAYTAVASGRMTPTDRVFCPGFIVVGNTRFYCWRLGGHGSLDMRGALKYSCDVFFYTAAMRTGIDRIAATAHGFGLGTQLDIDLPSQATGLIPTRAWRRAHGHPWNLGDTVVSGIGQGYVQVTPLQLATYVSRIATGRAVQPRVTRSVGDRPAADPALLWPSLNMPESAMKAVHAGMWATVNEPGGDAPTGRLRLPGVAMAGKTGTAQVIHMSEAIRKRGYFNTMKLPWKFRPHALFVGFAPWDAPRYAVSVVVEHGNWGADTAAPLARAMMERTLQRDPSAGSHTPVGQRIADAGAQLDKLPPHGTP